jgi:hypothetical protein
MPLAAECNVESVLKCCCGNMPAGTSKMLALAKTIPRFLDIA